MYLLALNPTDSVTEGFLPAAHRLGLETTILTDDPAAHLAGPPAAYDGVEVLDCRVQDFRSVVAAVSARGRPGAVFSNSDHLQVQAALAADYFDLPAKDWRVALRTKDKAEMRRWLSASLPAANAVRDAGPAEDAGAAGAAGTAGAAGAAGAAGTSTAHAADPVGAPGTVRATSTVRAAEVPAGRDLADALAGLDVGYPCVVKPREGVASEDVVLVRDARELRTCCAEVRARRPEAALVVEEFLPGTLCTLETLGDGRNRRVLGGFRTHLSPPPYFIEERLTWDPDRRQGVVDQVLAQLDALGVGFGACHTEFVVDGDRARIVEVNYRTIGDQGDLLLADLLGVPLFDLVLRVHMGEALPPDPWPRPARAACLAYPYARAAGTLVSAATAQDAESDGVRLTYRPLRATGTTRPVHHTNRDLLGVVRAIGPDQETVDRVTDAFVAAQRWEIAP